MTGQTSTIDTSYLNYPQGDWGFTDPSNKDMVEPFKYISENIDPKRVVEIGMFAGHSTVIMLSLFKNLDYLVSYDPNAISQKNAPEIKKRYNKFHYVNTPIRNRDTGKLYKPNLILNQDVDLLFIDGGHSKKWVESDLIASWHIYPKWILMDNLETPGVRAASKGYGLWDLKYEPKYFFYTNVHKGRASPGIFGLFKIR